MSDWFKKEEVEQPDHSFDIDAMRITNKLIDVKQEGNFLVAVTEYGVRFRQRLPANKIIDKKGDRWILKDRVAA